MKIEKDKVVFINYLMKNEENENLEIIKRHYNYSNKKAREVIELLSDEQIQSLKDRYGGEG